jgi:hypothetical protein
MIAEGDRLLVRLAQCLRGAFMIAHWELQPPQHASGDEFVVLAMGASGSETEERLARLEDTPTPGSPAPGERAGENTAYAVAVVEVDPADAIIAGADQILIQRKRSRCAERGLVLRGDCRT